MKTTVITHFYNESYLLPFWLKHHMNLFDHGILIDHHSTDNSVEICKEIAPHWKVITSRLNMFDAPLCDSEVMVQEWGIDGWKMALTIAEFLCPRANNLIEIQKYIKEQGAVGGFIQDKVMLDIEPGKEVVKDLLVEKPWGIYRNEKPSAFFKWRNPDLMPIFKVRCARLLHYGYSGCYSPGRHKSYLTPNCQIPLELGEIYKYGYSPWVSRFIERKLSFGKKIPENNIAAGFGVHHTKSLKIIQSEVDRLVAHFKSKLLQSVSK